MSVMVVFALVIFLIVIVAVFTGYVAVEKGYSPAWFGAGLFFGPVALIAAAGLPDRRRDNEKRSGTDTRRRRSEGD
jgi:hypothetical protein